VNEERFARRALLTGGYAASAVLAFGQQRRGKSGGRKENREEDVSPAEDLMREHGLLKRVLLVYGEAAARVEQKKDIPPGVIPSAAKLIRDFIEAYHEKLEEEHLFPRFRKAGREIELVNILEKQHQAGRQVTGRILQDARNGVPKDETTRRDLVAQMRAFIRMYEPHEAREDTVLFPAFRQIVSSHEYDALGEDFEKKEHQLFGEEGFEKNVEQVAGLEKQLGIYDLAQFTPKA
jgi:hemerythrin-like domain-containing protein